MKGPTSDLLGCVKPGGYWELRPRKLKRNACDSYKRKNLKSDGFAEKSARAGLSIIPHVDADRLISAVEPSSYGSAGILSTRRHLARRGSENVGACVGRARPFAGVRG